jgi:hypothetical protein
MVQMAAMVMATIFRPRRKRKVNNVRYKSPSKKMGKATDASDINRGRRDPCINYASTCFRGSIFVFALLSKESSFL